MSLFWVLLAVASAGMQGYVIGRLVRRKADEYLRQDSAARSGVVKEGILSIAFDLQDRADELEKVLVVAVLKNGLFLSMDNGVTVEEARRMIGGFSLWVERCMFQQGGGE